MGVTVQLLNRVLLHRDVGLNSVNRSALITSPRWPSSVRSDRPTPGRPRYQQNQEWDLLESRGSALLLKRRPGRALSGGNSLPWLYSSIMGAGGCGGGGSGSSRSLLRLSPRSANTTLISPSNLQMPGAPRPGLSLESTLVCNH